MTRVSDNLGEKLGYDILVSGILCRKLSMKGD